MTGTASTIRIPFRVYPDSGEPWSVVATSRDVLTWEKTGSNRKMGDLEDSMSMNDMYSVAFYAARRQGLWPGTLNEFHAQVDIDMVDDGEQAPDPTPPAPTAG